MLRRVAQRESIAASPEVLSLIARHASGSFRDALGTLEQLLTYVGERPIEPRDVLDILGVADAERLFAALDAVIERDAAAALRAVAELARSGRDPGQLLRDLEAHARELLTVQVAGELPEELRLTPERDGRLVAQADRLGQTDAVRLLDLIAAALRACANGASPRIQLELVLIRAAAPELDPTISALLSRIERLEAGGPEGSPSVRQGTSPALDDRAPALRGQGPALQDPAPAPSAAAPVTPTAPEPSPPPTPPGACAPSLDAEALRRCWPAVIELVREENQMLAALLGGVRAIELRDGELVLGFPSNAAFLKRKAEQEEHRRAVMQALLRVSGASCPLRYELREEDGDRDEPASEPRLSGEELARRLVEEFDAEELLDDPRQRSEEA